MLLGGGGFVIICVGECGGEEGMVGLDVGVLCDGDAKEVGI